MRSVSVISFALGSLTVIIGVALGAILFFALMSCVPISHAALLAPAKADVCACLGVECTSLDAAPVRFVDGFFVECTAPELDITHGVPQVARQDGCYGPDGVRVALLGGEIGSPSWRGDYELSRILRHEYLHALGIAEHNPLMACQWER